MHVPHRREGFVATRCGAHTRTRLGYPTRREVVRAQVHPGAAGVEMVMRRDPSNDIAEEASQGYGFPDGSSSQAD